MPHTAQSRSFWRRSSQSITWLILKNKKYRKIHKLNISQSKIQQNKTTLVQLPFMTLGQETRWAYSTMLPSRHGANNQQKKTCGYYSPVAHRTVA